MTKSGKTLRLHSTALVPGVATVERFWSKVDKRTKDECWLFTGSLDKKGYGRFFLMQEREENWIASRFSYLLHFGEFEPKLQVCHKCDNPTCVNPQHLFIGTALDNVKDCARKGRRAASEKTGRAKLTEAQVTSIRELLLKGELSQTAIARKFGIGQTQVSRIYRAEKWAHTGPPVKSDKDNGAPRGRSKLKAAQVLEIRSLHAEGVSHSKIGKEFGVDRRTVRCIAYRKTWKHI